MSTSAVHTAVFRSIDVHSGRFISLISAGLLLRFISGSISSSNAKIRSINSAFSRPRSSHQ